MRGQHGFTLIEIMVVVVIVTLMLSFGYVGFNQLLERRVSQDMQSLQHWLQTASDRAQLEGAVYGVRIEDQQLRFLTYRQGFWLPVLQQAPWANDNYQLEFEINEDSERSVALTGEEELQPSLVFLPDGSQWPEGRIRVTGQSRPNWIAADDQGRFMWTEE